MKKIVLFLIVVITFSPLYSARLYRSVDPEYQELKSLAIRNQITYPSSTPVSSKELLYALDKFPEDKKNKEWHDLYNKIESPKQLIKTADFSANISVNANAELYIHNQTFNNALLPPYKDRKPMLSLFGEANIADHSYLYMEFMEKDPVMLKNNHASYSNFSTLLDFYDNKIAIFEYMTQSYQPFRVGLSFDLNNCNLQIGRNRQSLGRGIFGNFIIGDNFSMQEYFKLTWYTKYFSYILDLTHFDQQIDENNFSDFRFSGMHQNRVVHSFIFTPLNTLEFNISLGGIFQMDSPFDFRLISPLSIVHSYNNFSSDPNKPDGDEGNNILSLEASWFFLPGWNLNIQIGMDQVQLGYESKDKIPDAFGFLANIENYTTIKNGILSSYIEFAYTMPYLYLNYKISEGKPDYNYDFILGYGLTEGSEIQYTGYPFGPDSIVIGLGTKYTTNRWSASGELLWWIHGDHGIGTNNITLEGYETNKNNTTPTSSFPQHLIKLTGSGSYNFNEMFSIFSSLSCFIVINENTIEGRNYMKALSTLGISFQY